MNSDSIKFLRLMQVKAITGLSRSTIYQKISEGSFPRQVSICGARAVGWVSSEVDDWVMEQIARSRNQSSGGSSPNIIFRKPESQTGPQIGCAPDAMRWAGNSQRAAQGQEGGL
jgi:prophage regulatory protein